MEHFLRGQRKPLKCPGAMGNNYIPYIFIVIVSTYNCQRKICYTGDSDSGESVISVVSTRGIADSTELESPL